MIIEKEKTKSLDMELMTKEISDQAQKQFSFGSDMNQLVVAKFFDPQGSWAWYVINQDPDDPDYLWGIVAGFAVEMGSFSLKELQRYRGRLGLSIERDLYFKPITAGELWKKLNTFN